MARFKKGQKVKVYGKIATITSIECTPDGTPYYDLIDIDMEKYYRYTENTLEELFKPSTKVRINSTHGSSFRYQDGIVINSDYEMTFPIQVRLNGNGMYSYFKEEELDLIIESNTIIPVMTHSKLATKPDYTSLKNVNVETEDLTNVSTKDYSQLGKKIKLLSNITNPCEEIHLFKDKEHDVVELRSSCCCLYCSPPAKELKVKEKNIKTFTKLDVDEDIKARKKLEAKISASRRRVEKVKESFVPKEKTSFSVTTITILSVLASIGFLYALLF